MQSELAFLTYVSSDDSQCSVCHLNLGLAYQYGKAPKIPFSKKTLKQFSDNDLYYGIPPLKFTHMEVARYTKIGLEQFLTNPVPRYFNSTSSMYPLPQNQLKDILSTINNQLEEVPNFVNNNTLLNKGSRLFNSYGCDTCHNSKNINHKIPRLRIGLPLFSFKYFKKRVIKGSSNKNQLHGQKWEAKQDKWYRAPDPTVAMPAYPLSIEQLQALYTYIVNDRSDLPPYTASADDTVFFGRKLFNEVQKRIFNGSCKHCHSGDQQSRNISLSIFSDPKKQSLAYFPQTTINYNQLDKYSIEILQPGPDCKDSQIVSRLKDRHLEWRGLKNSVTSGMPLTLPPLPQSDIELLDLWTKTGCPTNKGNLCKPCS